MVATILFFFMGGTVLFAFIFFYYSAQNETGVGMVSISLELFLDRRRISRRSPASFVLAYLNGSYHAWCPRCRALYGHAIPSACTSKEAVRTNAQPPWPPDCFPQVHKQESNRTKKNGKERLFGSTLSMAVGSFVGLCVGSFVGQQPPLRLMCGGHVPAGASGDASSRRHVRDRDAAYSACW